MHRNRFMRLAEQALHSLPYGIQDAIENVAIVVENWPDRQLLAEMGIARREDLFGVYQGTPLVEREGGAPLLPDRIVLFQLAIESACQSDEEVIEQIRVTVLHEVGHYLGMSDEDLDRLGYG
jgi:predicted Zn-dependent protease with MMP-like domain